MPNYALYDPQKGAFILKSPRGSFDRVVASAQQWANRIRRPVEVRSQPFHYRGEEPFKGYTSRLYTAQVKCPSCGGNDQDAPCAYPSERKPGCLRDERIYP